MWFTSGWNQLSVRHMWCKDGDKRLISVKDVSTLKLLFSSLYDYLHLLNYQCPLERQRERVKAKEKELKRTWCILTHLQHMYAIALYSYLEPVFLWKKLLVFPAYRMTILHGFFVIRTVSDNRIFVHINIIIAHN